MHISGNLLLGGSVYCSKKKAVLSPHVSENEALLHFVMFTFDVNKSKSSFPVPAMEILSVS